MEAIKTEAFAFSDQATEMPEGTNMDTFNLINTLNTHIHALTRTYTHSHTLTHTYASTPDT